MKKTKILSLFLGPILFLIIRVFFNPEGLSHEANAVLATTIWIAIWWILEPVPIAVTSLLPIILFPLTNAVSITETTAFYGDKYVYLYLGGFMIALAIEKWNLHKRIAINIINIIGTNVQNIILGFMLATAFLSMWISNTATAVMMLPIAIAIVKQLKDNPHTIENENKIFGKSLMLGIAYSASIGGLSTLIGTPPNLVLAGVLKETYNYEITFYQWFIFAFPISIILLFICWKYLTSIAYKFKQKEFPGGKEEIMRLKTDLGKTTYEEKVVSIVFLLVALCWIFRSLVLNKISPYIDDTIIALVFAIFLFILPAKSKKDKILNWSDIEKLPWGIILLFGGGMALANAFKITGLAEWIGSQITSLEGVSLFLLLLIIVTCVNFLTEITSNLATTAMLLPILAPLAESFNIHPLIIMTGTTIAASCAFMLPVATPPNAVVFGSGYLSVSDMAKKGFVLNIISILLITLFVYFLLPLIWGIDPFSFPNTFK